MQSLIKLQNYLKTIGLFASSEELFNILTMDLNLLKPKHFEITFDRNCININLTNYFVNVTMKKMLVNNIIEKTNSKKRMLVDFSSPNIAKDMHVGHLRSTII